MKATSINKANHPAGDRGDDMLASACYCIVTPIQEGALSVGQHCSLKNSSIIMGAPNTSRRRMGILHLNVLPRIAPKVCATRYNSIQENG